MLFARHLAIFLSASIGLSCVLAAPVESSGALTRRANVYTGCTTAQSSIIDQATERTLFFS